MFVGNNFSAKSDALSETKLKWINVNFDKLYWTNQVYIHIQVAMVFEKAQKSTTLDHADWVCSTQMHNWKQIRVFANP